MTSRIVCHVSLSQSFHRNVRLMVKFLKGRARIVAFIDWSVNLTLIFAGSFRIRSCERRVLLDIYCDLTSYLSLPWFSESS